MDKKDLERIREDLMKVKEHCNECGLFLTSKEPNAIDTVNVLMQDIINAKDFGWGEE